LKDKKNKNLLKKIEVVSLSKLRLRTRSKLSMRANDILHDMQVEVENLDTFWGSMEVVLLGRRNMDVPQSGDLAQQVGLHKITGVAQLLALCTVSSSDG